MHDKMAISAYIFEKKVKKDSFKASKFDKSILLYWPNCCWNANLTQMHETLRKKIAISQFL